ncbi:MAG: HD domain-containing protein [Bacteroidales bacterium]
MNPYIKDYLANKVIEYYAQFPELMRDDIQHTQEVVSYTHLIAVGEGLSTEEVEMLEIVAWLHDIGCPHAKELYGNSSPVNQQKVGREVAEELLSPLAVFTHEQKQWLADIVGTHHQADKAQELNFQPLFEADLIVNLLSGYHAPDKAEHLYNTLMQTATGKKLFRTLIKFP